MPDHTSRKTAERCFSQTNNPRSVVFRKRIIRGALFFADGKGRRGKLLRDFAFEAEGAGQRPEPALDGF
jgi:hypothetical protein